MKFALTELLKLIRFIHQIQINDPLSESVAESIQIALENCQNSFKWDKWNCPANSFLAKRNSHQIDREQAFVKALTTASLIYTFSKNCTRGNRLEGCGCQINENDFTWSNCKSSQYVDESLMNELEILITSKADDAHVYANFHNARAAKIVSKQKKRKIIFNRNSKKLNSS